MKALPANSTTDMPAALGLIRNLRHELTTAFVVAGLITLFVNLGLLFVPVYDMILYDRILRSKNMDTLTVLTIGCIAGMVLYGVLEFCRTSVFLVMADRLARRLNLPALQAAFGKSLGGEASNGAQAMRDINALRLFVASPTAAIPLDVLWTPVLVAVLFLLHPAYGVYGLLCAGILLRSRFSPMYGRAKICCRRMGRPRARSTICPRRYARPSSSRAWECCPMSRTAGTATKARCSTFSGSHPAATKHALPSPRSRAWQCRPASSLSA